MERIGPKPSGLAGLQQKLLEKVENQARAQAVALQLRQTRTGFDAGQTSPLNLFPQATAATSTAQTMSLRDAQRLQQLGSITQTRAVVDNLTRGLSPADKALVEGKVGELVADDRSIEKTTPQRFAANLALEISEHIGAGEPVSPQLESLFKALVVEGKSVFESNPMARQALVNNVSARQGNLPQTSVLDGLPNIERTRSALAPLLAQLSPDDRRMVEGKVAELVNDGRSIEKTNPARFAANLALELSEHIGAGLPVSPQLDGLFRLMVKEGDSVFRGSPAARQVLESNLGQRERNLQTQGR